MGLAMQQLARNDRHVRRARLRMNAGASKHRLVFNIEEALRLCSLPGEDEGRVYYFRHLRLSGVPDDASRGAWLEALQRELLALAGRAVHGSNTAADTADAVCFLNEQEACASFLALVLQRRSAQAWFWSAVSGAPADASPAARVVALVERLRRLPASWMAVAAVVFAAVEPDDPNVLLNLLPDAVIRRWLSELGEEHAVPPPPAPIRLPVSVQGTIARAAAVAGPEDPGVLLLASLAVILAHPSELERGVAVGGARLSLRAIEPRDPLPRRDTQRDSSQRLLAESERAAPPTLDGSPAENGRANAAGPYEEVRPANEPALVPDDSTETIARSITEPDSNSTVLSIPGPDSTATTILSLPRPGSTTEDGTTRSGPIQTDVAPRPDHCLGEATNGAGLYFLLNALRWLRGLDDPLSPHFLAHLFQRIAHHAGIRSDDPILLWTIVTLDQSDADEIDERLLRIWVLKVRRWCWQNGKISVREIVRRPGLITLTRTDLDVSLALDSADIRIRRLGLDLDPGWLPWFGRVVRFHYRYRGELHA